MFIISSFSPKNKYAETDKKRKESAASVGYDVETSKFFKANVKQIKFKP